jgi:CO/xanthine dehydrogenase FAD-binding subunit
MLGRLGLPSFDYVRPATADEVIRLLHQHGTAARLLMGGTDLLPRMRDGLVRPKVVIDVKGVPGIREIGYDAQEGLTVGAAVSLNALACHADVWAHFPLLAEAATSVASYQVRNRATLGGNLCNASPAADTAPAVLCLDARMVIRHSRGIREVPASEFFLGPGRAALQAEELLLAVRFPVPPAGSYGRYLKLGRTRAGDLAIVGVAVYAWPDGQRAGGGGAAFRIGLASVAPVPMRARAAEDLLVGQTVTEQVLKMASEEAARSASPMDDVRASCAYRREMVRNLVLRGAREVAQHLGQGDNRQ